MINTEKTRKKRLREAVDKLTEENQHYALGILQALAFAQTQETTAATDKAAFSGCKAWVKRIVSHI
jgi:hypothetical protein